MPCVKTPMDIVQTVGIGHRHPESSSSRARYYNSREVRLEVCRTVQLQGTLDARFSLREDCATLRQYIRTTMKRLSSSKIEIPWV